MFTKENRIVNIQKATDINFKANRVLTATKRIKPNAPEIIDVFHIDQRNPKDINFVRNCLQTMKEASQFKSGKQRHIKEFFEDFLTDIKLNCLNFNLAIKDGERIVGGYESIPVASKEIITKVFFNTEKSNSEFVGDSLIYNFLTESKDCIPHLSKDVKKSIAEKIVGIDLKNPHVKFEKNVSSKDEDLLKVMGIDEYAHQSGAEIEPEFLDSMLVREWQ